MYRRRSPGLRGKDRIGRILYLQSKGYEVDATGRLMHRVVYEKAFGKIPRGWVVHHVDENKKNNTPLNLVAMPTELHNRIHTVMVRQGYQMDRDTVLRTVQVYVKALAGLRKSDKITINITINVPDSLTNKPSEVLVNIKRSGSSTYR